MLTGAIAGAGRFYGKFTRVARSLDWLGPLALRLYLGPIMIVAGLAKLASIDSVAGWFGTGLGFPMPVLMVWLASLTELFGGIALLLGLGTRLAVVPLMFVMAVAAVTVHWEKGWHILPERIMTVPWEWRGDLTEEAVERQQKATEILKAHGDYEWLTEVGRFTVLKNGIELAATYFIMLLALLGTGGGRFVSLDYWLCRRPGGPGGPIGGGVGSGRQ